MKFIGHTTDCVLRSKQIDQTLYFKKGFVKVYIKEKLSKDDELLCKKHKVVAQTFL